MVGTRSKIAFWPSRVGLELIFELLGKLSGDNVGSFGRYVIVRCVPSNAY